MKQTVKADRIILWLAESERHLVPENVLAFASKGIEIKYCDDIRSYKKIVPTLIEEPNAFIVTADDDLAYQPQWLEKLIAGWDGDYKTVVAHRAHKIRLGSDNTPFLIKSGNGTTPSPRIFLTLFSRPRDSVRFIHQNASMLMCSKRDF